MEAVIKMKWLRRTNDSDVQLKPTAAEPPIEIVAHQNARQEVVEQTKKANEHLKELLVQNGFTIKIYLATNNPKQKGKNK